MLHLNTITTSLSVNQKQQEQAQLNIANLEVDKYARHDVILKSQVDSGGRACGVDIETIVCHHNRNVFQKVCAEQSSLGFAETVSQALENFEPMMGFFAQEPNIGTEITTFFNAVQDASLNCQDPAFASMALQELDILVKDLQVTSKAVQERRLEIDHDINASVQRANILLQEYQSLGKQIVYSQSLGHDPIDLKVERDHVFYKISREFPVKQVPQPNGDHWLYLSDGTLLVTSYRIQQINFTPSSSVGPHSVRGTQPQDLSGIKINLRDITDTLAKKEKGQIPALFHMRDTELPNIQKDLDAFSYRLVKALNAQHNEGTSYFCPTELQGRHVVDATALAKPRVFEGTLRVGVVEHDKTLGAHTDIDLTPITSIQGLVDAINTNLGGGVLASITSDRFFLKAADPAQGVALASVDPHTPARESATQEGISAFLGLNNILDISGYALDNPDNQTGTSQNISVRANLLTQPFLYAHGTLNTSPVPQPLVVPKQAQVLTGTVSRGPLDELKSTGLLRVGIVDPGKKTIRSFTDVNLESCTTVQDLVNAINKKMPGTAAIAGGALTLTAPRSYESVFLASLSSDKPAQTLSGQSMVDYFGMPTVSLPQEQLTAVSKGDRRNSEKLLKSQDAVYFFAGAGRIVDQHLTLKNYAVQLISTNALVTASKKTIYRAAQESFSSIDRIYQDEAGVNASEEVTKLAFYSQHMTVLSGVVEVIKKTNDTISRLMQ